MKRALFLLGFILSCNCMEAREYNPLAANGLIGDSDDYIIDALLLPDGDKIILFKFQGEITSVCRISDSSEREFTVYLQSKCQIAKSHAEVPDYVHDMVCDYCDYGNLLFKYLLNGDIERYRYDQMHRLVSFTSSAGDFIFLNKKRYLIIKSSNIEKKCKKFLRTENILGYMDSFVIKDNSGDIILVVVNNIPYIPVLDEEGSLRKILDENSEDIASVEFSSTGHVVEVTGESFLPYCYKGMYQDKYSKIYFSTDNYYDADLGEDLIIYD